jgi:hypothetical protein
MTETETAERVIATLKAAEQQPAPAALALLNDLVGDVQGDGDQPLEVEDARSSTFLAICEVAKALHRRQPADQLWAPAIDAASHWMSLAAAQRF